MATPSPAPSPTRPFLARLVNLHPGEGPLLALATTTFFLILFGYYLLRPLREAFGIARGADKLPWLMTGTLVAMFVANPAFAALVSRLPRRQAIPWAYRLSALVLGLFYVLFRFLPAHALVGAGYAFYIWLSVFNLFAVSVFWAFLSDGLQEEQGHRLFAFIALGGTLGAIAGAFVTERWTHAHLNPGFLLLATMLCLEGAVQAVRILARRFGMGRAAGTTREPGPGLLEGIRLFASSPYLLLIGLYILLFTVTSTLLYLQQGRIVAAAFPSTQARTAAFARLDLWVNILTLFTQVFLAGRIITRLGMRAVLCVMPVLTLAGFGALLALPTFGMLAIFQVLRRGLHYAVDRPARETLFIPLGPEEKYKSKPFIDTFIYRTGDLLGTWTPALLAALSIPAGALGLAVSALWLGSASALGRLHHPAVDET